MIRRIALVTVFTVLLAACQMAIAPPEGGGAEPRPDDPTARPEPRIVTPQLDVPIELAVGETVTLHDPVLDNEIELTFTGVREDTRCPDSRTSDVMCSWSGAVEVEMTATVVGQTETFPLLAITDYDGVVEGSIEAEYDTTIWYFAGYHFELKRVTPYPLDERPQPESYVVTVVVRRVDEPLPTPTVRAASIQDLVDEDGLPVLCVSEMAMTKWMAGDTDVEPSQLTPPLAMESLPDTARADEICALAFGDGWRIADAWDLDGLWSEFVPLDTVFRIGDSENDKVVEP